MDELVADFRRWCEWWKVRASKDVINAFVVTTVPPWPSWALDNCRHILTEHYGLQDAAMDYEVDP